MESQPTAESSAVSPPPQSVNFEGIESSLGQYLLKRSWVIALLLVASVALVYFLKSFFGVLPIVLCLIYLRSKYENNLFSAFAQVNGYQYSKNGPIDSQDGIIFMIGHGQSYFDVVSGNFQNWPFLLFMYRYTIGYGRNSHRYERAVMAVNFNTAMAAFVLRRHKLLQVLEDEGESLRQSNYTEKLNLEGDFNKHFQVYIRPNTQVEVLSILTPDVMQNLIGLDKYEIEMNELGVLYVYCRGYITKKQELIDIYSIIESVARPLGNDAAREQLIDNMKLQSASNEVPVQPPPVVPTV